MWDFIITLFSNTFSQLFSIFGTLFIFGILLYLFARMTRVTFRKSFGAWLDVVLTGWIGTPVHELGHAIFCILFGHKITGIKLYWPNPGDGTLGYVNHAYNSRNIYHRIGNFFIGFGPIILGSLVIYLLMSWMLPNDIAIKSGIQSIDLNFSSFSGFFISLKNDVLIIFKLVFSPANFSSFLFYLFLYLSLSIASHMELSPPDIKSVFSGLMVIAILFLILNLILLAFNVQNSGISVFINKYTGFMTGFYFLSLVLSGTYFIVIYILGSVFSFLKEGRLINPFK